MASQDVSIKDENTDDFASVHVDVDTSETSISSKSNTYGWDDPSWVKIDSINDGTYNRLAVNARIVFGGVGDEYIYDQPVYEYKAYSTAQNQINYTVPTGKKLYILTMWTTLGNDGGTICVEFQDDGTGFASAMMQDDGTGHSTLTAPAGAPWGSFAAGSVIRARRVYGDSGKRWASGFTGYLVDV